MAVKRMFSKKIIDSDMFLDMPLTTQALYFHLNMRADDDGFIGNPKTIQRLVRASEDDLKLLILKGFLIPLDHGVMVVKHWMMHNTLRKDRYSPTPFQDEGRCLYVKGNGAYTLDGDKAVAKLETRWQQTGNTDKAVASVLGSASALGLEKMLLPNKENKATAALPIVESTATEIPVETVVSSTTRLPHAGIYIEIQNKYNRICTTLQPVERLTKKRKGFLDALFEKGYKLEDFEELFNKTMESEYFNKLSDGSWKPSFDWLIQEDNMIAVLEGKYDKTFDFKGKSDGKTNKFSNFKGRGYSSDDVQNLERQLLGK